MQTVSWLKLTCDACSLQEYGHFKSVWLTAYECRPPESIFSSEGNSGLPRIQTVPEEEPMSDAEPPSSSDNHSSQPPTPATATASLSHNWRFSPINSPVSSAADPVATARIDGNGWRRTGSLRRTTSSDAGGLNMERSACSLSFCLSACLPACLSVCLSVRLSVCLMFWLHIYLYAWLSVCLSVCCSMRYWQACLVQGQKSKSMVNLD